MVVEKELTLNSGYNIPIVGLGTWQSNPGEIRKVVQTALGAGYRHFDCAQVYGNEAEIGEALEDYLKFSSSITRKDIFITSKVWNTCHSYDRCRDAVEDMLKRFRTSYLDLVLIHWPHGFQEGGENFPKVGEQIQYSNVDYLETWKALESKVEEGKIRSIGLSNFNKEQIQRIVENGKIKPAVLQVELHLYFQQEILREFCKPHGIIVTAYSPLGSPGRPEWMKKGPDVNVLCDPLIQMLANKYNKTPAQVILRSHIQNDIVVIPKSTNEARIRENIDVFDFEINETDMAQLNQFDCGLRLVNIVDRDGHHKYFPWPKNEKRASEMQ